jgi:hypothetical protein
MMRRNRLGPALCLGALLGAGALVLDVSPAAARGGVSIREHWGNRRATRQRNRRWSRMENRGAERSRHVRQAAYVRREHAEGRARHRRQAHMRWGDRAAEGRRHQQQARRAIGEHKEANARRVLREHAEARARRRHH